MTGRMTLLIAGMLGALGVMIGAFGAHALPGWLERQEIAQEMAQRRLHNLEVGARYQMYHVAALMVVGVLQLRQSTALLRTSGWCFLIGILIFSGCLYAYSITGIKQFAAIVVVGGFSFIIGWIVFTCAIARSSF